MDSASNVKALEPFRVKAEYQDEVTLLFDDGKELYVSAMFLKMASPVFKVMLESEFKEKATGIITLSNKKYDDFLKLLESLHPGLYKPITEKTVFIVLPLAQEYRVTSAIQICRDIMSSMTSTLERKHAADITKGNSVVNGPDIETCLRMMHAAEKYSFDDLKRKIVAFMQNVKTNRYTGKNTNRYYIIAACNKVFESLSEQVKFDLLLTRLEKIDAGQ